MGVLCCWLAGPVRAWCVPSPRALRLRQASIDHAVSPQRSARQAEDRFRDDPAAQVRRVDPWATDSVAMGPIEQEGPSAAASVRSGARLSGCRRK